VADRVEPKLSGQAHFETKLDIHDRKQFELKLEYQPSGTDPRSEYMVETLLFIPRSLNVTADTWPRAAFYADLHNYVRLKTPVLAFDELLAGAHSPLVQLQERIMLGLNGPEREVIYDAKMLACVLRGALRRFAKGMKDHCATLANGHHPESLELLQRLARRSVSATQQVLTRFRSTVAQLTEKYPLGDKTKASLRLVDEYVSLLVEHYFRRVVVNMEQMPRSGVYADLRRELMGVVVNDEGYRRASHLPSVIAPDSDNEEYTHRISFLKKFCMNILFLKVLRSSARKSWEELALSISAGSAMALALSVSLFAQSRAANNATSTFFMVAVFAYVLRDRAKEAFHRVFSTFAGRYLYERTTRIQDPVTHDSVGVCKERIDYDSAVKVPAEIKALRAQDDLITVAQGEVPETVIRYRKHITLDSEMLPRIADGLVAGVTDIIRLNVERMLHDMDDPEYALDYVDIDDFSVERLKASKSYRVDLAFRFSVDDGKHQETKVRLVRLVLDRNGIKRMNEIFAQGEAPLPATVSLPQDPPVPMPAGVKVAQL
jgi:hypothetical protein